MTGRYEHAMRRLRAGLAAGIVLGGLAACSPENLVGNADLPSNVTDPAATETPRGALAAYYGALITFRDAFGREYVRTTGILSDELQDGYLGGASYGGDEALDRRMLPAVRSSDSYQNSDWRSYRSLQRVRGEVSQALGLLRDYPPDTSSAALRGHLYAIEGYAEVMLAELFCSGIPLSTLDYRGDWTLRPGSTTEEVLRNATALFDTALALGADSARVVNLARVGRGRALLDLGDYAGAAAAVADVPDDFSYAEQFNPASGINVTNFAVQSPGSIAWSFTVSDREGINGIDYRTSLDPRTAVRALSAHDANIYGTPMFWPAKYQPDGGSPIVLADGIEARLIQAEAALHGAGGDWLAILNALRTNGTFTTSAPDSTGHVDTTWAAGTGHVAGLRPLTDPGDPDARVDLLFRERAAWLFLTGHRQGDLRRLVRQYGRDQVTVYPTGQYGPGSGSGTYGNDVNAPVPPDEESTNPLYHGCLNRDA
ncbi:MAG: hypothetical protein IRY91_03890 [Gemmatimonadaceae bacterium]|nr:hypothetical protein [Gemmatimonadaceae bacterium]